MVLNHCPTCTCKEGICEVYECELLAEYEGWWRVKDFAGIITGLIQQRKVCGSHVMLLIGKQEKEEKIARGLLLPKSEKGTENLNS